MAYNVKFLKGTRTAYNNLATKDANTFYYTDDNKLFLGTIELSNGESQAQIEDLIEAVGTLANLDTTAKTSLVAAINEVVANIGDKSTLTTDAKNNLVAAINELDAAIDAINNASTGILKQAKDYTDGRETAIRTDMGDKANLDTTAKENLVAAINEVKGDVGNLATASAITVTESSSEDYAKVYTIAQGGTTKGTINIPKDMVVESGRVVVDPDEKHVGTFIELTLANATRDKIYVNVGSLVDIYTAKQSAAQVQLDINSSTREISATIVTGSITSTELAADSVVTAKIADGNVTKVKLAQSVQDSLDLADSAVQKANIITGSANGTISVKGDDVAVKGLKSAAYTESSEYATAAQGAKADSAVQSVAEGATNGTINVDGTEVSVHGLGGAAYKAENYYDLAGAATTAENNAKAYTDSELSSALSWGTIA